MTWEDKSGTAASTGTTDDHSAFISSILAQAQKAHSNGRTLKNGQATSREQMPSRASENKVRWKGIYTTSLVSPGTVLKHVFASRRLFIPVIIFALQSPSKSNRPKQLSKLASPLKIQGRWRPYRVVQLFRLTRHFAVCFVAAARL